MKCIKCGHRRMSRVFLGYHCSNCGAYYCYVSKKDWAELLEKQKYTCKQLKEMNGI